MSGANRLGLDFISGLAMPPLDFLQLASDLGLGGITLALQPMTQNPCGFPGWSLREDAGLRRELAAAAAQTGVVLRMGEVFLLREGVKAADFAADLALMAEMGVQRANLLSISSDDAQNLHEATAFAAMAKAQGIAVTLEYMAGMAIGSLADARALVAQVDNLSVLLDCLHLARSGSTAAELASCAPGEIGYLQLCDATLGPPDANYGADALHNRLMPGEGQLPLAAILAAAPRDLPIGLEVPMKNRVEAGGHLPDLLREAVARAQALLAALPA